MVIFVVAALAGFLLFGWIVSTERPREFFKNPRMQCRLGLLALVCALVALMFPVVVQIIKSMFAGVDQIIEWMFPDKEIEPIQWPEYWTALIVQRLTGTEAAHFILGAAFGCILRYWGPQFWTMRMRPGTRYNWVAISLVGLLLLAAAIPYIGSLLRDWGVTGLKTPVAEFEFTGKTNADRVAFEVEEKSRDITLLPAFAWTDIKNDLAYLRLSHGEAQRIDEPSTREKILKKIGDRRDTYNATQDFIEDIVSPLAECASLAYEKGLDPESIRHALSPVAQELRLLIRPEQSQNSNPSTDQLRDELMKSFDLFKIAAGKKKCRVKLQSKGWKRLYDHPKFLTDAPHIYVVLARLDRYNDNRDMAVSILKQASRQFGYDRELILQIPFLINYFLANYLHESEHTPEDVFLYLDAALVIAQNTRNRIEKLEDSGRNPDGGKLQKAKDQFETYERAAKNALAFFSAKTGLRKFMALRYAEENYDEREKLQQSWMKPEIIDTYGYVKLTFAARSTPPNFDEIKQAKSLFQEALGFAKILSEGSRNAIAYKRGIQKKLRARLKRADRLLASR